MTANNPKQPEVTEGDREAAWAYRPDNYDWMDYDAWMRGDMDDLPVIIDFTAHRLAAERATRERVLEELTKAKADAVQNTDEVVTALVELHREIIGELQRAWKRHGAMMRVTMETASTVLNAAIALAAAKADAEDAKQNAITLAIKSEKQMHRISKLEADAERLAGEVEKIKVGYESQMKFCDIEPLPYFREFVCRLNAALASYREKK